MPTQWTLTLNPPPSAETSPAHVHALACRLLETGEAAHAAQTKPFTAALDTPRHSTHAPAVQLSWLDEPSEPDPVLDAPVHLGPHTCRISACSRQAVSYARLAASPPVLRARVEFTTPAYISRAGRQLPLPEPELLLGGLARRWAAFSPVPLAPAAVAEMLAAVHLARHDIATVAVRTDKIQRVGFVGHAVFGLASTASRGAQRAFAALWAFAEFAGVGAQTAYGLGHIRRADEAHPARHRAAEPDKRRPEPAHRTAVTAGASTSRAEGPR